MSFEEFCRMHDLIPTKHNEDEKNKEEKNMPYKNYEEVTKMLNGSFIMPTGKYQAIIRAQHILDAGETYEGEGHKL